MTFQLVGLTEEGKRIYASNMTVLVIIARLSIRWGQIYIVENKSLAAYLRQLAKMGEDPEDYVYMELYERRKPNLVSVFTSILISLPHNR